jgi:hypothetical protein
VEKREKKREEKIIARAPFCPDGWHMPAHLIEGGTMLRTLPWKVTNNHREASHTPPKGCEHFFLSKG